MRLSYLDDTRLGCSMRPVAVKAIWAPDFIVADTTDTIEIRRSVHLALAVDLSLHYSTVQLIVEVVG